MPDTIVPVPRYQSLDAWRGFACLLIVIFHSTAFLISPSRDALGWWLTLGVPIFFVLSGYCITAACDGKTGGWAFFRRRLARIYPPYWAFLLLLVIVTTTPRLSWAQWLGNVTLTETWRFHLGGERAQLLAVHAWTLCYEEQFYVVTGIVLWLLGRDFLTGLAAVTLGVLGLMALHPGAAVNGYFCDGYWLLFAAGIGVYALRQSPQWQGPAIGVVLTVALATIGLKPHTWWYYQAFAVGPLFAVVLLLLAPYDAALSESPWLRPFTFCGRRCYSLYLLHVPIAAGIGSWIGPGGWATVVLLTAPLTIAVSLIIVEPFHRWIELPCQRGGWHAPISFGWGSRVRRGRRQRADLVLSLAGAHAESGRPTTATGR